MITGETNNDLLNYLKRNFRSHEVSFDWMNTPMVFVVIDNKLYPLKNRKKYMVNKITSYVEEEWSHIKESIVRRTVKKYLDGI